MKRIFQWNGDFSFTSCILNRVIEIMLRTREEIVCTRLMGMKHQNQIVLNYFYFKKLFFFK